MLRGYGRGEGRGCVPRCRHGALWDPCPRVLGSARTAPLTTPSPATASASPPSPHAIAVLDGPIP